MDEVAPRLPEDIGRGRYEPAPLLGCEQSNDKKDTGQDKSVDRDEVPRSSNADGVTIAGSRDNRRDVTPIVLGRPDAVRGDSQWRETNPFRARHDLRTPLNAIALATRVLDLTYQDQIARAETEQMLKTLGRNVQYLHKLVEKIIEENTNLQTESGVKLERRELDLWPLVEGLIHDLRPVAGTGSTQLINDVPNHLIVYADASLLRRVFQNLIANAIKSTPRGEVRIGARELDDQGEVECWVADNGAGFSQDHLAKVFDELETDSERTNGLGLGLAIVKTFIEAHGGKVTVESKLDFGSTFRFTLPDRGRSR